MRTTLPEVPNRQAIDEAVRRIASRFDPEQIILFGSYARGTPSPDSDLDFLVVLRKVESKRAAQVAMRIALSGIGVPSDVIVTTTEELARRGDVVGTIVKPALDEGVLLYERS